MDNRYYVPNISSDLVEITGGEFQHLSKVRRAKVGDRIVAFSGDGYDYNLEITEINKNSAIARVISKTINKSCNTNNIVVYLAMIKNEALVEAVDHLAELNVKCVKLFRADRSVAIIDEKKLDKLNQISIQASKQCERADIMKIELIDKKHIEQDVCTPNVFFAYEDETNGYKEFNGEFSLIIGPEGGFSEDECRYFKSFSHSISLGKTILRAEVACVAGVSMLKAVNHEG